MEEMLVVKPSSGNVGSRKRPRMRRSVNLDVNNQLTRTSREITAPTRTDVTLRDEGRDLGSCTDRQEC